MAAKKLGLVMNVNSHVVRIVVPKLLSLFEDRCRKVSLFLTTTSFNTLHQFRVYS